MTSALPLCAAFLVVTDVLAPVDCTRCGTTTTSWVSWRPSTNRPTLSSRRRSPCISKTRNPLSSAIQCDRALKMTIGSPTDQSRMAQATAGVVGMTSPLQQDSLVGEDAEDEETAEKGANGGEVDLFARTWESLDFGVVLDHLSSQCRTEMGRELALVPDFKTTLEEVHELYERVDEILRLPAGAVPLQAAMGVHPLLAKAEKATTLEPIEIMDITSALEGLQELREWFCGEEDDTKNARSDRARPIPMPCLEAVAARITLDEGLLGLLRGAFDGAGELSASRFPEIGRLRNKTDSLRQSIRATMNRLLTGGEFSGMLAGERDACVTEISGRFVIPVLPTYKRTVGIVHDTSRTGKTIYVEPSQVVAPTNELVEAKLQLKVETQRILTVMTVKIAQHVEDIRLSLLAAAEIDVARARAGLARKMDATIPEVRDEGTIRLANARHPVLLLRGKHPVGNSVALDDSMQSLVLTGPNAGGKTVVLKTLGLVALMARAGIPIPAEAQARVDLFNPVLADIGDLQSVTGDLSTFSGHLVVAKAVLNGARAGSLVLMDEMGSGTDPMQGAALAQSLLEALLDAGARVALTTHYTQLKELAARDERFGVAAMQFVDGRPTYRLVQGAVGESFALQVAERLELPPSVVERARDLLDENTRQVSDLIRKLEQEREELQEKVKRAAEKESQLASKLRELEKERVGVEKLRASAKRKAAAEYAATLEEREKKMKEMFDKARKKPSLAVIGGNIGEIRAMKAQAKEEATEVRRAPVARALRYTAADLGLTPLKKRDKVYRGDKVVVCAGEYIGLEGEVAEMSNRDVAIFVPSMENSLRFPLTHLSRVPPGGVKWPNGAKKPPAGVATPVGLEASEVSSPYMNLAAPSTSRRVEQYLDDDPGSLPRLKGESSGDVYEGTGKDEPWGGGEKESDLGFDFFRTEGNTLDLRGMTMDEAEDALDAFVSRQVLGGAHGGYVLHGHGTGVLKAGVRRLLPRKSMVARWRPAEQGQGGDAYTIVIFKRLKK